MLSFYFALMRSMEEAGVEASEIILKGCAQSHCAQTHLPSPKETPVTLVFPSAGASVTLHPA